MNNYNESLIVFGLEHHDARVRELAEAFHNYRKVVSKFVGSEKPITIMQSSAGRRPIWIPPYDTGRWFPGCSEND